MATWDWDLYNLLTYLQDPKYKIINAFNLPTDAQFTLKARFIKRDGTIDTGYENVDVGSWAELVHYVDGLLVDLS